MQITQEIKYYDSDPNKAWVFRFDVLFIKRDHRRILNVQPKMEVCHGCKWECANIMFDFEAMAN